MHVDPRKICPHGQPLNAEDPQLLRHGVDLSARDTPQPWKCKRCGALVRDSPDDEGFISINPYIINEEQELDELLH